MTTKKPEITLPDGTVTDTWSKEYMLYCEALNLSKKSLRRRQEFLEKLTSEDRIEKIKYWLTWIWDSKH